MGPAAAALAPMVAAVVILRGAREGLRAFGGKGGELRAYGVGLWSASLLVLLSFFGSSLRSTTHHHALAGVTFAFGAVVFAVGSALACVRVIAILQGLSEEKRGAWVIALGLFAIAAVAWTGLRFFARRLTRCRVRHRRGQRRGHPGVRACRLLCCRAARSCRAGSLH